MSMSRLLGIAAIAFAAACGSSTGTNPPPPPPPPPAPPPPPPPPPAPTLSVSVADNSFSPSNGPLSSGGTVTWNWPGAGSLSSHNITFEDGQGNSGNQTTGSHQRTFPTVTTSTTFRYRCTNHSSAFGSGMSGQIVVTP